MSLYEAACKDPLNSIWRVYVDDLTVVISAFKIGGIQKIVHFFYTS